MPFKYWHIESHFHYFTLKKNPHNFWTRFENADRNVFIRTPQISYKDFD